MIELTGQYNTAKVFTDLVDDASIAQIRGLLDQEFIRGLRIRMMPDVHAGAGCTVGTTMTVKDRVVPNLVGVDIGCGMEVARLRETRLEPAKLDRVVRETVPAGFERRKTAHKYADRVDLSALKCAKHIRMENAVLSLGSLGGGNHFIEADRGEDGEIYLVIHSGSRHLGLEVAGFYQKQAVLQMTGKDKRSIEEERNALIAEYKAQGRETELAKVLRDARGSREKEGDVPKQFAYCAGYLFDDYIHDMRIVQEFATLNRQAMMDEIVRGMKFHVEDRFTSVHNYIDTDAMILRKGATSAREGERLIIPMNMRDGSLICTGKGNEDWNCSAPHGAGRIMSRSEARSSLTVSQMKKEMEGIYTTSVNQGTLDEAPMAYKPMEAIVNNISDTVRIDRVIKPIYNFKAGDEE
ncbi:MAG: RtcB family protein [Clostridia bacterium]|nr:RtcB family protein [Clostridia bacterium]